MPLRTPTIADIYVKQLRTKLDRTLVPIFPPDEQGIRIGTIGRFEDGRFDRRGHLSEVLGGEETFAQTVPAADPTNPGNLVFHSEKKVDLSPSVTVSVGGTDMLKSTLSFTGSRAVVASFTGIVENGVRSPRDFDALLLDLYLARRLKDDEVVVYVHREAASGTVIINRSGGVEIELLADPALLATITFEGLGAGVKFGEGSQASVQTSGTGLTVAVKAKGLLGAFRARVDDVRHFEGEEGEKREQLKGIELPEVDADDVIEEADFEADEE